MRCRKKCVVCGGSEEADITYHRFPKKVAIRKSWLEALQLDMDKISDYSVVCSRHFDIIKHTGVRTRVPRGAIPQIRTATTARIKCEEVELKNMGMFDSTENMVDCMKTEDEFMIEITEPKIETRQDTEDYGGDTTADFGIVLKSALNEKLRREKILSSDVSLTNFEEQGLSNGHEAIDRNATASSKTHECANGEYKTTINSYVAANTKHPMLSPYIHSKIHNYKCIQCNANFDTDRGRDNHILKNHPNFISSICLKVHECIKCTYKTMIKSHLDNHILRKHPDLSATVSAKIYECKKCTYKNIIKRTFDNHVLRKHPELGVSSKIHECTKCTYKSIFKRTFDNHILRKHQELDISSKIHECTNCSYKTTLKRNLYKHISNNHPGVTV